MNEETQSIVYVGDMRQQTRFGTIQSWDQIGEQIAPSRIITLDKVYRNTKEILRFIQSLGYNIEIPDALPEGTPVVTLPDTRETQEKILAECLQNTDRLIGILAKETGELGPYIGLKEHKHIKVLTVKEAQGVEFDTVFLVGNKPDTWVSAGDDLGEARMAEKKRINRDLLYVALTRAMRELYVVGEIS
jgi:superfamily I DNA/RNA helicase